MTALLRPPETGEFLPAFNPTSAVVKLPIFHPAQAKLRWMMTQCRLVAARCGRRWGKNALGEGVAVDDATHGRLVAWCAPENKRLSESYNVIVEALEPVKKASDKTHGVIRTITGGRVDFWSLEDPNACRSRKYHRIIVDEAAFGKPKLIEWWNRAARPTLVDYRGRALVMSNTNGIDPDNFFYQICHNPKHGFVSFHAPSRTNPYLPADEVARFETDNLPLVYQQEYLAEFVDWSGNAFFRRDSFLVDGQPIPMPYRCEAVFATIDTATKVGSKNDGTAVVFWAVVRPNIIPISADGVVGSRYSLVILDWDIKQIEGALLETWLPTIFQQLQIFATQCRANRGSLGAMIEDKASGMVLLQQARRRGWPATAIDSKLTDLGKDARAISVSGYVYRGLVKISLPAYDKVVNYKGATANHLLNQIVGFRVGDKDTHREDDLFDCAVYGIAVTLGDSKGF